MYSVMSDSLRPYGLQPTWLPCPWNFSRQEYWSRLPFLPPRDLPDPGIKPSSPILPSGFFATAPPSDTSVQFSHSVVSDSANPCQASLSFTLSRSLLKFVSIVSLMPSNHLILCCPHLLLPSIFQASGSFPMSRLFVSDSQSTGASASASVLPMNIQG